MDLHTQISLITVPQEFMRLCNAVLAAEFGDDYLATDDDRADRGNDGYLKSEKRIFAVHCFKRVQNQSLDAEIRRKMIGDLGKAITLKREGIWDIDAWTFISNYPISEEIAAQVLALGKEAALDVSWRGPDFLATALQRHTSVRERFPSLQVSEISEQLSQIGEAVGAVKPEPEPVTAVPRTPEQRRDLLLARPDGWEYLLFASVLYQGKEELELKWHDHRMPPYRGAPRELELAEASQFLQVQFDGVGGLIEALMAVFDSSEQEQAFGPPREPGDPVRIEHFAKRIVATYEELLDWAAAVRSVAVPEVFAGVMEIASRMADQPMREIREFIDEVVSECDRIPGLLADPDPNQEQVRITLTLTLTLDPDLSAEFGKRIKRAQRKLRWGF